MEMADTGFEVVVHADDASTTLAGTFAAQFQADDLMQRLLAEGKLVSIRQNGKTIVPMRGATKT